MERVLLDTNIIIRALTNDNVEMAQTARRLLKQVESGELRADITESILVEAVQVLSSPRLYAQPRLTVASNLSIILGLTGLRIARKALYVEALEIWATSRVDFVDALSVAYMREMGLVTIVSFDRDFNRFPGITRTVEV